MRVQQAGKNASGQTHYLSLSGFELYGTVVAAVEEPLGKFLSILKCSMEEQESLACGIRNSSVIFVSLFTSCMKLRSLIR